MTQTVLLGDICDVRDGTHDSPKPKDSGHPLVTSKHIKNHKIDFSTANLISDEDFEVVNKRSKVDQHDILISMIGTVGELALIDYEPTFAIKNIGLIKTGDELLGKYLFYYLQSTKAKQYIEASLAGSTQKFIGLGQLRKFPVELPDIETQKKIADILGTIDEKIELNRQMNETLEQMGQALFRHYFIDNPEAEKWEDGVVSDLITIYSGYAFKRTDFDPDGDYGLVTIKNVQDGNFVPECSDHLSSIPVKTPDYAFLNTGDILLSLTGNVGRVCIVHGENLLLNQRVAKLVGADDKQSFAYFMFRQEEFKNRLISMSRGTAQLNLSPIETKKIKLKLPPKELLAQYHEQAEPLFEAITANYTEIQTLTTLRDTLLPRLISGKVKV